jgi:hypothetical protein
MWFRVAVDVLVVVHLLFICFVVGGVFLAWRWQWIIWMHIPAVIYGALIEFVGFTCPLTPLEDYLRRRAGEAGYSGGFINHYLVGLIYPHGLTHAMKIGLGIFVLVVAVIGYRGYLRRHPLGNGSFRDSSGSLASDASMPSSLDGPVPK